MNNKPNNKSGFVFCYYPISIKYKVCGYANKNTRQKVNETTIDLIKINLKPYSLSLSPPYPYPIDNLFCRTILIVKEQIRTNI